MRVSLDGRYVAALGIATALGVLLALLSSPQSLLRGLGVAIAMAAGLGFAAAFLAWWQQPG